jgi:Ca2+-binding RTX toxin-like protein
MATAFRIELTGDQEVPPTGFAAHGLGTIIFDPSTLTATYSIHYTGLDFGPALGLPAQTANTADDVTSHHVHNAPRGTNGSIVFGQIGPAQDNDDLLILPNADGSWTVSGRWDTNDPANVSISTFASQLGSAQVGSDVSLYFNAHTTAFQMGAIRGQWVTIADDRDNTVQGTAGDDLLPGLGGNDRILGDAGNDILLGATGNDRLSGENGDDLLNGGSGNDSLNGNAGNDLLLGGTGKDGLTGSTGNDRLLAGSNNDRLQGGDGDDFLFGQSGDDRLNGGLGTDLLSGGGGFDTFVFSTPLGSGNVDIIKDFRPFSDTIRLDNTVFTGLPNGALSGDAFHIGTAAADSNDRIIYNSITGALYFDPDGAGSAGQIQFATLLGSPNNVTASDFFVI